MVSASDLTIKNGSTFDYFYCIKVLKFQVLVSGRFENDLPWPQGGGAPTKNVLQKMCETIF